MKDIDDYIDQTDVEQIDIERLDYIVHRGTVYSVVVDDYGGDPYLIPQNGIPDGYRERWGMDE